MIEIINIFNQTWLLNTNIIIKLYLINLYAKTSINREKVC